MKPGEFDYLKQRLDALQAAQLAQRLWLSHEISRQRALIELLAAKTLSGARAKHFYELIDGMAAGAHTAGESHYASLLASAQEQVRLRRPEFI